MSENSTSVQEATTRPSTAPLAMLPGELVTTLRAELRALARAMLQSERPGHTLQPTAILNELWLKLAHRDELRFESREAFIAYATEGLRHILVDHARKRLCTRRGGRWTRVNLDLDTGTFDLGRAAGSSEAADDWAVVLSELDEELELLRGEDSRAARVFELRFIGGLTVDRIATILGLSPRTIRKDWATACGWLRSRLEARGGEHGSGGAP